MSNPFHARDELLSGLSSALDCSLSFDSAGQCGIEFDGDVKIVIAVAEDLTVMSVRAAVSQIDHFPTPEALRAALELNYGGLPPGKTLALDAASGQLVLITVLEFSLIDAQGLLDLVSLFFELVPQVRTGLAGASQAPERVAQGRSGLLVG